MSKLYPIYVLIMITAGPIAADDFLDCVRENSACIPPTQTTIGEYSWVRDADTLTGYYYLVPPQAIYITTRGTVEIVPFDHLKDPWFEWWADRNPIIRDGLYTITYVADSNAFRIYDYRPLDARFPCVRVAFDRGICEPFSAHFYWPAGSEYRFDGAATVYYEFIVTDRGALAPKLAISYDDRGNCVARFDYKTVDSSADSPPANDIIEYLLSRLKD